MCFSAEADFAVAAVVAPVGVASLRAAARPQELLFAALPLLLALHQLTEGVVWLGLQGDAPGRTPRRGHVRLPCLCPSGPAGHRSAGHLAD